MLGGFLFARPLALLGAFGTQKGPPDLFVGFAAVPHPADQKWQRVLCLWVVCYATHGNSTSLVAMRAKSTMNVRLNFIEHWRDLAAQFLQGSPLNFPIFFLMPHLLVDDCAPQFFCNFV
jgi:hypothetical protein